MTTTVTPTRLATSVPHLPGRLPLLGDVRGLDVRAPIQSLIRMAGEIGPAFERKMFNRRIVLVTGAELAAELSDESRFEKFVGPALWNLRDIAGDGLFTALNDEPNWRKAHDLLHPAFTQSAMRTYHETMLDVAGELAEHWDSCAGQRTVEVSADMTKLTLETIGRTGFGYSFDSFRAERPHPFVDAMVGALRHSQRRTFLKPPYVGDLLWRRAERRNLERLRYMNELVDAVIRERVEHPHADADDLLELMLRAARAGGPGALSEVNIRYQIITFLVAGHETTSGALSFALYYLSKHPDVLAEARADTVLGGRYAMKAGEGVLVVIPAVHRDPDLWGPDALEFDPDRFTSERVKSRPAHIYKPFGTGERACIGRQFALHEAVLVLGTILRRYQLEADPSYELKVQERLTLMPQGFRLALRRR